MDEGWQIEKQVALCTTPTSQVRDVGHPAQKSGQRLADSVQKGGASLVVQAGFYFSLWLEVVPAKREVRSLRSG